jgi:hypothetical protein
VLGKGSKKQDTEYTLSEYNKDDPELATLFETSLRYAIHPEPITCYGMHCTFCGAILYCPRNVFINEHTKEILNLLGD